MDWGELKMQIEPQYIGVLFAILIHAGTSIWWASKINTTMNFQNDILKNLQETMIAHEAMKYSKEEAAKDFAVRDKQFDAIWKKLDQIHG